MINFSNKKGVHPVVATALLLVVAVVSLVYFSSWFNQYQTGVLVDTEEKSLADLNSAIDALVLGSLYIKAGDELNITLIKVNNNDCNITEGNYSGIVEFDLTSCLESEPVGVVEVMLLTDKGVSSKYFNFKGLGSGSVSGVVGPPGSVFTQTLWEVFNYTSEYELYVNISSSYYDPSVFTFNGIGYIDLILDLNLSTTNLSLGIRLSPHVLTLDSIEEISPGQYRHRFNYNLNFAEDFDMIYINGELEDFGGIPRDITLFDIIFSHSIEISPKIPSIELYLDVLTSGMI